MIRTCDNGHLPARVQSGTPCRECERRRPSSQARGYDTTHQRARAALLATLPTPCAYGCGIVLQSPADMVAAHVVDGDPSAGWVASCRSCNERAKRRGWGGMPGPLDPAETVSPRDRRHLLDARRESRSGMSEQVRRPVERDPLVAALARYLEALHRRYPDGPDQLHRERLDGRAKVSGMVSVRKDPTV